MPDAAIADLVNRVAILEAHAQQLGQMPGQLGGLSGDVGLLKTRVEGLETALGDSDKSLGSKVERLEITLGDPKKGLLTKVEDLETKLGDPKKGLLTKVEGLETAVGDPKRGLETRIDNLRNMIQKWNPGDAPDGGSLQKDLVTKVSRIEGQISMAKWLGPLAVAIISLVIQLLTQATR